MYRPNTLQATYTHASASNLRRVGVFAALLLVVAIGVLRTTTAGSSAFYITNTSASEGVFRNSQSVELLEAAHTSDLLAAQGGGDVRLVENVALVSDLSPFDSAVEHQQQPQSDQISLYTVQEGDTLSQIATMFNVSVSTIVWANDLTSSKDIQPGITLLILPVSGVQHTVRAGDTLASIAKKYGGDVDEIIAYNNLDGEGDVRKGVVITIPGGEVPVEKAPAKSKGAGSKSVAKTSGLIHPVPGSVRTQGIHGYNGVDFGAPSGTPIRAAAGGTVIVSKVGGWNGGYGNYVVIDHPNGTQTLYAHNLKNAVSQGQSVSQGEVVGYVGNTGRSTGNHLHFEVRGATNPF